MISPDDIKQKSMRLWNSGRILRAWLDCEDLFPLVFSAGKPTATQLLNDFTAVENWKSSVEAHCQCHLGHGYRIEYAETDHRQLGQQRLPEKLVFDQADDLIAFINKGREVNRFARLLGQIRKADARLMPWCERYPLKVLAYEKEWSRMLSVLDYFKANPVPDRYLEQMDIPLVDSQFIERHKLVISQLLDQVLPAEGIN